MLIRLWHLLTSKEKKDYLAKRGMPCMGVNMVIEMSLKGLLGFVYVKIQGAIFTQGGIEGE